MVIKDEQLSSTVGYRCPHCLETVLSGVGIFRLSGNLLKLKCSCGGSEALIERKAGEEGNVNVTVPCFLCKKRHRYLLGRSLFARQEKDVLRFSCPHTGVPVLYLGGREDVVEAVREDTEAMTEALEDGEEIRKLLFSPFDGNEQAQQEEYTQFSGVSEVVRYMLAELQEEGMIHCGCEEAGEIPVYDFTLEGETALRVFCESCHKEAILPLTGVFDAERILSLDSLTLK